MKKRLLFVIVLLLVVGCQQSNEGSSGKIVVSELVVRDDVAADEKIANAEEMPKSQDIVEEAIYKGRIIVAVENKYKVKPVDSVGEFRFEDEKGKFVVSDVVKFKLNRGIPYDVVLIERSSVPNRAIHKASSLGEDITTIGIAEIMSLDYGRFSVRDDNTLKRFVFYMEGSNFGIGDKIRYFMNRNGYVIKAEKID